MPQVEPFVDASVVPPTPLFTYTQLLRGPRHRWWRPLVGIVLFLATLLAFILALLVVLLGAALGVALATRGGAGAGLPLARTWLAQLSDTQFSAIDLLANNLLLASLIPTVFVAVWGGHRVRIGLLGSVEGRLRWGWMFRAAAIAVTVFSLVFAGLSLLPGGQASLKPEQDWLIMTVIMVLTTPLQSAGEEFLFRGWLSQAVGSWFSRPLVAAVAAGLVSSTLFAIAHGSSDPWLFADRFSFGVVASVLTYRTGGLEAGIAVHTVNNLFAFSLAIITGQLSSTALVSSESPVDFVINLADLLIVAAIVLAVGHRLRLRRWWTLAAPWPVAAGTTSAPPPWPGPAGSPVRSDGGRSDGGGPDGFWSAGGGPGGPQGPAA